MYVFMEILHISVSALLVSLFDAFFFFFPQFATISWIKPLLFSLGF